MKRVQAPRGTFDVLSEDGRRRLNLFNLCQAQLDQTAGLEFIDTPVFEDTDVFARGVGEATDIVQKEMFTFEDKGGRSLTLRPEGTAPICRAYVEHGMHKRPQPVRFWHWGSYFRHEAPQAGRFRQFTQVGVELLGTDEPSADAEVIALLEQLLRGARCDGLRLRLASLGTAATRREYSTELGAYLQEHAAELPEAVRERISLNPLRAFDSDDAGTQAVMREAPKLLDRLVPDDAEHFAEVRALLDSVGIEYEVDPALVRGLDYYTRTVFEFTSDALGAQSGVGGGGRYDGLVELFGGPATPGVGFAAGIDRMLLAANAEATKHWGQPAPPRVYVALAEPSQAARGFALVHRLRREYVPAQVEQAGRSLKGQLKQADRLRARFTAILGEDGGLELKDMESGDQRPVSEDELVELARA